MRTRDTHEQLTTQMFWVNIEPLRKPGDLYEFMRLYDAKNDRVIILQEEMVHGRSWSYRIANDAISELSMSVHYLCRMLEAD